MSPRSGTFRFDPSARLQRFLGRELIADPNLAVAEFVKNAYDAGSSQVVVDFLLADHPREHQILTIADDGTGMTRQQFEDNWMRPGYSYKAGGGPAPSGASSTRDASARQARRAPIGEKGLGRLAAGRLGNRLEVWTRTNPRGPWLHVTFKWADFEGMNRSIRSVPISWRLVSDAPERSFDSGTVVQISDLTINWGGRVPGRKTTGRSDVRLGRLRQDLMLLVQPIGSTAHDFEVTITADDRALRNFLGPLRPARPQLLDYRFDFRISRTSAGAPRVHWRLVRSREMAEKVRRDAVTEGRSKPGGDGWENDRPETLRSGPFSGHFFYSPDSAQRARDLAIPQGVFLYRDGIRVDPYGNPDDDWLGAKSRKAVRQGHAAIQPKNLTGYVDISKSKNPDLVDMSNRQGLVETPAYEDFLVHTRAEFRRFEELIREEYLGLSWEPPEEKTRRAADRATRYAQTITRAVAHTLRQPVAGLDAELSSLRAIADDLPKGDLRGELLEVHARSMDHLEQIDSSVERLLGLATEVRIERVPLKAAASNAAKAVGALAETHGVKLRFETATDLEVTASKDVVHEAIAELVRNAVQAPRASGVTPEVVIQTRRSDGAAQVRVTDNGIGLSPAARDKLFSGKSSKGRPAQGLVSIRELLALFRANVTVDSTANGGATFVLTFPTDEEVRKEIE